MMIRFILASSSSPAIVSSSDRHVDTLHRHNPLQALDRTLSILKVFCQYLRKFAIRACTHPLAGRSLKLMWKSRQLLEQKCSNTGSRLRVLSRQLSFMLHSHEYE
eukprot:scaffold123823_cov33-Prasinocladus_malaysianus.AAC.1